MVLASLAAGGNRSFDRTLRPAGDLKVVAKGALDDSAEGGKLVNNDGERVQEVLRLHALDLGLNFGVLVALIVLVTLHLDHIVVSRVR